MKRARVRHSKSSIEIETRVITQNNDESAMNFVREVHVEMGRESKMRIHKHFAETEQRNICKIFEIISVYLGLCICQIIVRECSLISAIIIVCYYLKTLSRVNMIYVCMDAYV